MKRPSMRRDDEVTGMQGSTPRSAHPRRPGRWSRVLAPAIAALVVSGTVLSVHQLPSGTAKAVPAASRDSSVAVWESALQGRRGRSPDVTVRQLARASVPAQRLRVRFGNPFGT